MDTDAFKNLEVELQGRGTPTERLRDVGQAFGELAKKKDEEAAAIILAQLQGKNHQDPSVLKGLSQEKVGIIAGGIATIRRGGAADLIMTAVAAGIGVSLGYASHRVVDGRFMGVPLNGLAGALPMVAGASLDSTLTTRNMMVTGGAMWLVGSLAYGKLNPE